MSDLVFPLLKEAFEHADGCYTEVNEVIDALEQALELLPADDTKIQASITHIIEQAYELMDTCSAFSHDLTELRIRYRASHMPSPFAPEVDELLEVLARIETRRRKTEPKQ